MSARRWIYPITAAAAALFFAVRLFQWRSVRIEKERQTTEDRRASSEETFAVSTEGLEGRIGRAAKTTGVKKLLSVALTDGTRIEWESDPAATVRFLKSLSEEKLTGRCERLQIAAASEPPLLRASGVFAVGPAVALERSTETTPVRNVFSPLWREQREASLPLARAAEDEKRRLEQQRERERAEQERRQREEAQQLQTKKRELETGLVVNGIVNNGREPIAFINARSGGQTLMLHSGDTVEDARVTAIDETKGEVRLDYLGKFQVLLRLNAPGNATP